MIAPLLPLRSRNSYGMLSAALAIRGVVDDDIHGNNAARPEVTIASRRVRRGEEEEELDFSEDSSDDDDNDNGGNDDGDLNEEEVEDIVKPTAN